MPKELEVHGHEYKSTSATGGVRIGKPSELDVLYCIAGLL